MEEIADAEEKETQESRRNKKGSLPGRTSKSDKTMEAVTDEDYDEYKDLVS